MSFNPLRYSGPLPSAPAAGTGQLFHDHPRIHDHDHVVLCELINEALIGHGIPTASKSTPKNPKISRIIEFAIEIKIQIKNDTAE